MPEMTDAQIIKIAEETLYRNDYLGEWFGKTGDILEFARAIRQNGYDDGYEDGFNFRNSYD